MKKLDYHQLGFSDGVLNFRSPLHLIDFSQYATDPSFLGWVREFSKPRNRTKLRKFIRALVASHEVRGWKDGLDYIYSHVKNGNLPEMPHITVSDIKKRGVSVSKFNKALGEEAQHFEFTRRFGVFLHGCLADIWSQRCFKVEAPFFSHDFALRTYPESSLMGFPVERFFLSSLNENYLDELGGCWDELAVQLSENNWIQKGVNLSFSKLRKLLRSLTFKRESALEGIQGKFAHFGAFFNLALMSLASAVLYVGKTGHCAGLSEIPVVARRYGMGGWRVDMLVVKAIDGVPPTAHAIQTLNRLQRLHFSSLPQVLGELKKTFRNAKLEFIIRDFKFSLGDAVKNNEFIRPHEVDENPLPEHVTQLKTYIALASFSEALAVKRDVVWKEGITFADGELVYVFPNKLPVIHSLCVDPLDQRTVFHQNLTWRINRARERAKTRLITDVVMNKVVELAPKLPETFKNGNGKGKNGKHKNGNGKNGKVGNHPLTSGIQTSLIKTVPLKLPYHKEALRLIECNRTYLDPLHIVEELEDRKGMMRNWVHLDRLLDALRRKKVKHRYFRPESGGLISCLMPGHDDRHPSMRAYVNEDSFHCYVCGGHALIHPDSIPPELRIQRRKGIKGQVMRSAESNDCSFSNLEISPEHFQVMGWLQVLLRRAFKEGTLAWNYVRDNRKIDPELARHLGAGFFSAPVARDMFDMLGFEGMVYYGFIGFSSYVRDAGALSRFLKGRGMQEAQFTKREKSVDGGETVKMPYFYLKNCVTFPLAFWDSKNQGPKVTSVYGRVADDTVPKEARHRKLSNLHTGVPPGMMNCEVFSRLPSKVEVIEGPFDVCTLYQIGMTESAVGNCGTLNRFILTEVIKREVPLWSGYDNDKGGRDATVKTEEYAREIGGKDYPCFNFTEKFLEEYPEARKYDDYNSWWIHEGYAMKK